MMPEFILTSLLIIAAPGTGALYTIANGIDGGARRSLFAALGCTLGVIPHMMAAMSGVAVLLHTSIVIFQILKYLGVAYLFYMAWSIFRDRNMLAAHQQKSERKSNLQIIISAIFINLLNPKLSIFFLSFLPQFIRAEDAGSLGYLLQLSLIFMVLTFVVFACYGVFAAFFRRHVIANTRVQNWLRRGFAVAFAGLAIQLAFVR